MRIRTPSPGDSGGFVENRGRKYARMPVIEDVFHEPPVIVEECQGHA